MKISEVFKKIPIKETCGNADLSVNNIYVDNRKCEQGDGFVCIKGFATDGHQFAEKALEKGASLIVAEDPEAFEGIKKLTDKYDFCGILLENTRTMLADVCSSVCGNPSASLNLIGVTGTKGKTTTTCMIKHIYDYAGRKTGLVGTMYNMVGERKIETERTTPDASVLQPLLRDMVKENVDTCVMEVSSQGLNLNRVGCCEYDTAIFTNLSPDHIGPNEHKDMDDYANAKSKLFSMCRRGIVNADNKYSKVMLEKAEANKNCSEIYTYAIDSAADFTAENIILGQDFVEYDLKGKFGKEHIRVLIPGKFTVYNSMAAAVCCFLDGISFDIIKKALSDIVVCGKAEKVPTGKDFTVIIDYAHNPDSFINILTTVRAFAKRTVFLFGCGGDRNRPRALMGKTAGENADFTIITSDNPRSEDPDSIVRDIEKGIKETGAEYICITDRREAIHYAIKNARPGDVIVLAGKGHETYQIFKDKTVHFDEREIVREALSEL